MPYCSVMVLKKLGSELTEEFHSVVHYLGHEQGMQVVVEPSEHAKLVSIRHKHDHKEHVTCLAILLM